VGRIVAGANAVQIATLHRRSAGGGIDEIINADRVAGDIIEPVQKENSLPACFAQFYPPLPGKIRTVHVLSERVKIASHVSLDWCSFSPFGAGPTRNWNQFFVGIISKRTSFL
jgi:hypothetical protein